MALSAMWCLPFRVFDTSSQKIDLPRGGARHPTME
jgi:hypothetical protein